jgi:hypothetical protein
MTTTRAAYVHTSWGGANGVRVCRESAKCARVLGECTIWEDSCFVQLTPRDSEICDKKGILRRSSGINNKVFGAEQSPQSYWYCLQSA